MQEQASNYTVQTTAKMIGVGSKTLFKLLHEKKIIDHHNLPYQRYIASGYFTVRTSSWDHRDTGTHFYGRPMVTQKGVDWLRELIQENNDHA